MKEAEQVAAVLTSDGGRRWISEGEIMPAVHGGAVVLVPGALERLGLLDEVVETTLGAVRDLCDAGTAEAVRRVGFEGIHEILDGEQLESVLHETDARLYPRYPSIMKQVGHGALGLRRPFYIHALQVVRLMAPYDFWARNKGPLERKKNLGRLRPHGPHQDHWFSWPLNAVNLWMAIGSVQRENSLCIFSDAWGAELPQHGITTRPDQYLGVPLRVACDPGDVVVFHTRHVHGTGLNLTSATRFVLSGRFCDERPLASTVRLLDGACLYSPLVGTPFERWARLGTRTSWVYLVERLKKGLADAATQLEQRFGGAPLRLAGRAARRLFRYRRADRPLCVPEAIRRPAVAPSSPEDLAEGEIAALDDDTCAARVDGRLCVFARRCPHAGGDFAFGYVSQGKVYCTQHSYGFDPDTGRGASENIRPVRIHPERCRGASAG